MGGFFLALVPLHVQHSHYIYADIPVTLASTLLLYCFFKQLTKPSTRSYLLMGFVFGWAVSIKYTAAYFIVAYLVTQWLVWRGGTPLKWVMRSTLLALVISGMTFFAISPFVLLDWTTFVSQIHTQAGAQQFQGWFHHLVYSLAGGVLLSSADLVGQQKNSAGT